MPKPPGPCQKIHTSCSPRTCSGRRAELTPDEARLIALTMLTGYQLVTADQKLLTSCKTAAMPRMSAGQRTYLDATEPPLDGGGESAADMLWTSGI
jgi:hypothetical protein